MTDMSLTDLKIRKAKPRSKPVKLSDGGGLTLVVRPAGSKSWKLRFRVDGKERDLSLGTYPAMSLADAREAAEAARTTIASGADPLAERRREEARQRAAASNTFEDQAKSYIASRSGWSDGHRSRFVHRMTSDVYPIIGGLPIGQIQALDVVAVAQKIVDRGAVDTSKRVASMISQVFMRSIVLGFASSNPATGVAGALGDSPAVRHRPALVDAADLRPFLQAVRNWEGRTIAKDLVEMILLVFQRPGEVRKMRWSEIDFDTREWVFTVSKVGLRDHIVPLSMQAFDLLERLREGSMSKYVFPNSKGAPVSDAATSQFIAKLGFKGKMTAHGSRAVARTVIVERLGFSEAIVEMQLSHAPRDTHGHAYNRVTWRPERHQMMAAWADWLDTVRAGGAKPLLIAAE